MENFVGVYRFWAWMVAGGGRFGVDYSWKDGYSDLWEGLEEGSKGLVEGGWNGRERF